MTHETEAAPVVTVKPLVWEPVDDGYSSAECSATGLTYEVWDRARRGIFIRVSRGRWQQFNGTISAAKVRAQADYERRKLEGTNAQSEAAVRADERAKAEVKPLVLCLPYPMHGYGVCVGGRFDGWLMSQHPDGQWISKSKLDAVDPLPAAMKGGDA